MRTKLHKIAAASILTVAPGSVTLPYVHAAPHLAGASQASNAHVVVHLKAVDGNKVSGTANFTYNAKTNQTTVTLTVQHLKANSLHPAHIHAGRCGSTGATGAIVHPFATLHANAGGVAKGTIKFAGTFQQKVWAVNVHNGPSLTTATQAKPIACGNV